MTKVRLRLATRAEIEGASLPRLGDTGKHPACQYYHYHPQSAADRPNSARQPGNRERPSYPNDQARRAQSRPTPQPVQERRWRPVPQQEEERGQRPAPQQEMTSDTDSVSSPRWDQTAQLDHAAPLPQLPDLSAVLLVFDGELAGRKFVLEHPVIMVGRGSECDVVINDASISRQHAQFLRQADGVYVQDLNSRNGTRINGEPLLSPRLVKPGDIISIGSVRLKYAPVQSTDTTSSPFSSGRRVRPGRVARCPQPGRDRNRCRTGGPKG